MALLGLAKTAELVYNSIHEYLERTEIRMNHTERPEIAGKNAGEISRNIAEFLSKSVIVKGKREMNLASLLPTLNMKEQYSYALLMEAQAQGWDFPSAQNFYLRFCAPAVGADVAERMLNAFRDQSSSAFREYREKYGCDFTLSSRGYWSSCFAVAADAKAIPELMEYFRAFVFSIMEFAYMGNRNPDSTYVWSYYESFQRILSELTAPSDTPQPLIVRSLGGTAGKRDGEGYELAFGLDIENPNPARMAWNVKVDIHLKDRDGKLITTIQDQINCIDPNSVVHYGITRKIRGNAVAHISVSAKTEQFNKLELPLMKHIRMEKISINRQTTPARLNGILKNNYDCPLYSFALHYQFLSKENQILGGGCEWFFEEFPQNTEKEFSIPCPVPMPKAAKIVYSVDFDAKDLLNQ